MRTNIDIDDQLMENAMKAGPYKTKKDAVDAGLKLLARQAAYREILKWQGKLKWEGDESIDWTAAEPAEATALTAEECRPAPYGARRRAAPAVAITPVAPITPAKGKRRAGR